jgi:spore coat polysaccharide biosynthesis protein SpsF
MPATFCQPGHFPGVWTPIRISGVGNTTDYSNQRWTLDTEEDLQFVRCIYNYFGHDRFTWKEVLDALNDHPDWLKINQHIKQKDI